MPWFKELRDRNDVLAFNKYLGNLAGHELKKIMPQLLRIRQVQLKDDSIQGTWQGKTPEARIAEIICSFGHTRMIQKPDGTRYAAESTEFENRIRGALNRWLPTVVVKTVTQTESDPSAPGDPRDPRYFALAATKLAANPNIAPFGPLTRNASIDLIFKALGSVADSYDDEIERLYDQFRRYAQEQAARQYEDQVAAQDAARLNASTVKEIKRIRDHQQMKLDGRLLGRKGGHDAGQFWLLVRSVDGMPLLLVSSKEEKEVKDKFIGPATSLASASDATVCTGLFSQDRKAGEIRFYIERGQTQTPVFVAALNAIGVRRATVLSAPAGGNWGGR